MQQQFGYDLFELRKVLRVVVFQVRPLLLDLLRDDWARAKAGEVLSALLLIVVAVLFLDVVSRFDVASEPPPAKIDGEFSGKLEAAANDLVAAHAGDLQRRILRDHLVERTDKPLVVADVLRRQRQCVPIHRCLIHQRAAFDELQKSPRRYAGLDRRGSHEINPCSGIFRCTVRRRPFDRVAQAVERRAEAVLRSPHQVMGLVHNQQLAGIRILLVQTELQTRVQEVLLRSVACVTESSAARSDVVEDSERSARGSKAFLRSEIRDVVLLDAAVPDLAFHTNAVSKFGEDFRFLRHYPLLFLLVLPLVGYEIAVRRREIVSPAARPAKQLLEQVIAVMPLRQDHDLRTGLRVIGVKECNYRPGFSAARLVIDEQSRTVAVFKHVLHCDLMREEFRHSLLRVAGKFRRVFLLVVLLVLRNGLLQLGFQRRVKSFLARLQYETVWQGKLVRLLVRHVLVVLAEKHLVSASTTVDPDIPTTTLQMSEHLLLLIIFFVVSWSVSICHIFINIEKGFSGQIFLVVSTCKCFFILRMI
mmetsp:Transcript_10812/g.26509  ORF Transcript_10812/g.26509 Transcript_10812/m.26509 type:complete len:532 (-) Transcript_10812:1080-2675(-)